MGVSSDGLLEEPVEEQTAAAGGAPVEPKGELVEVVAELADRSPVVQGACEPALEQGRDPVHAGQGAMGGLASAADGDGLVAERLRQGA